jgi:hypothetical protein
MKFKNFFFWPLLIVSQLAMADSATSVTENIFGVELTAHSFVKVTCIITGSALIMASFIQFQKHRKNPIATKLSTPIFSLLTGIGLILLSFIPMFA